MILKPCMAIRALSVVLGASLMGGLTACDHTTSPELGAADIDALVAATAEAPRHAILDDLGLDGVERQHAEAQLAELHAAMNELHEMVPKNVHDMSEADRAQVHEHLQASMGQIHEMHSAFVDSLSDSQRATFAEHLHAVIAEHNERAAHPHLGAGH